MSSRKITVIGAGAVGSATAFALAIKNIANEIVMVDINEAILVAAKKQRPHRRALLFSNHYLTLARAASALAIHSVRSPSSTASRVCMVSAACASSREPSLAAFTAAKAALAAST